MHGEKLAADLRKCVTLLQTLSSGARTNHSVRQRGDAPAEFLESDLLLWQVLRRLGNASMDPDVPVEVAEAPSTVAEYIAGAILAVTQPNLDLPDHARIESDADDLLLRRPTLTHLCNCINNKTDWLVSRLCDSESELYAAAGNQSSRTKMLDRIVIAAREVCALFRAYRHLLIAQTRALCFDLGFLTQENADWLNVELLEKGEIQIDRLVTLQLRVKQRDGQSGNNANRMESRGDRIALPKLNEKQRKMAGYIRSNPGKTGAEIAFALDIDAGSVRRIINEKLKPYGFYNDRNGDGYFPPKESNIPSHE